jgi:GTP cyclohydrolase I
MKVDTAGGLLDAIAGLDPIDGDFGVADLQPDTDGPSILDEPRVVSEADWLRYEGYLAEILGALGLHLSTPGTRATPHRFLRALFDTTAGYEGDPKLLTAFPTECHGGANCEVAQVVEGPIPFFALCEHHALPFFGNVYVGYVAHEGIIGISKLTRLVRVITRRFGPQERMTYQIADELERMMAPHGVAVYVEAHHLCTQARRQGAAPQDPDDLVPRRLCHEPPASQ